MNLLPGTKNLTIRVERFRTGSLEFLTCALRSIKAWDESELHEENLAGYTVNKHVGEKRKYGSLLSQIA